MAHRAAVRQGERLRRAPPVSAVQQDRLQRAQPLLRALSRQVHVPLLHGRVHAQRHTADACALQASGVLLGRRGLCEPGHVEHGYDWPMDKFEQFLDVVTWK